ncbi:heterokaryon incompatibility protein [Stagonosporopsis vannaccii]|nr:heterokaryon incompatibility protein [Stagonosporopsis vannaccii]
MEGFHAEYQYRPLDPGTKEIRLLRIAKTESSSPISLELRHVTIDESEKFNALSYCWGEGSPDHGILIQDGPQKGTVFVRTNLFDFLRFAYETNQSWSSDWIWIDQICINQNDHRERCRQVGLMGELYTAANATVIWPGLLPKIADFISEDLIPEGAEPLLNAPLFTAQELTELRMPEVTGGDYPIGCPEMTMRMLSEFTGQTWFGLCVVPYWKRLWIIQEIALASHDFVLINGQAWELCDLHDALEIVLNNMEHPEMEKWQAFEQPMEVIRTKIKNFLLQREIFTNYHSPTPTKDSFQTTWDFAACLCFRTECSLKYDRIYGLMGLFADKTLTFEPDYSITQEELLRRVLNAQLSFSAQHLKGGTQSVWFILHNFMFLWSLALHFEPIIPDGLVPLPSGHKCPTESEAPPEERRILQHNVRLLLRNLKIPIPTQITDVYGVDCSCEHDAVDVAGGPGTANSRRNNPSATGFPGAEAGAKTAT